MTIAQHFECWEAPILITVRVNGRLGVWPTIIQRSRPLRGLLIHNILSPALKVLGYSHSSAIADWLNFLFVRSSSPRDLVCRGKFAALPLGSWF